MASPRDREDAGDGQREFLEGSYFSYLVPFATDFKPATALRPSQNPRKGKFDSVEHRHLLFFDETVDVYLVLRTPRTDDKTLRSYLRRLTIALEAQIVNAQSADRGSPPSSETIYKGAVEDPGSAIIAADETEGDETEDDEDTYVYAVWKLSVFLPRPRIRLQAPSVIFSATASLGPADPTQSSGLNGGGGYMQSGAPAGLNLLEAFAQDPMLDGVKPQLSALRVSRVAPVTQSKDLPRPIRGVQSLKLKIFPIVHTRVRFARPNTTPPSPALIALLEVDFTPFFDSEATLNKLTLNVTDGIVEDLNTQEGMDLPLSCVAHDHLTFLYRLAPQQLDIVSKNPTRDLDITIDVTVLVRTTDDEQPNICTPHLAMSWTTNIDFTLPVNPGFGQPITQPIQRAHRPSQLSIGGGADAQSLVSPSVSRPDALPSLEAATARPIETAIPDFGITMTFSGPDAPVYAGEEFVWTIFVVNRSSPAGSNINPAKPPPPASRKLALHAIPRRRRNELRVMRPPSSTTNAGPGEGGKRDPLVADAVIDENVVHAMQRSSVVDDTELVCLSADVRIGPLAPDACAVAELRFLALREGVVGVEAVRIVDLGTQEHVDVRELPVVVVQSR
ncbi:TRAPP trafficking subunit Trs65-domain-containing protein [Apodospora peruviana]|uniref:TRAPP trafficking subunit Trs65-domain-containing protein n=1 Tax=Apodospora peruviana TaxID=516989 RepID=A0AAE0MFV8_9PEZI|nr:TRAPP trafficking subunit Trs65-domain-containing protein [Apodospora peruviana]